MGNDMKRWVRTILNGIAGMGMVDGMAAIIAPPDRQYANSTGSIPTIEETWAMDGAALAGDWIAVGNEISDAMRTISLESHV